MGPVRSLGCHFPNIPWNLFSPSCLHQDQHFVTHFQCNASVLPKSIHLSCTDTNKQTSSHKRSTTPVSDVCVRSLLVPISLAAVAKLSLCQTIPPTDNPGSTLLPPLNRKSSSLRAHTILIFLKKGGIFQKRVPTTCNEIVTFWEYQSILGWSDHSLGLNCHI